MLLSLLCEELNSDLPWQSEGLHALLGPTDEVIHCGFQNGFWTELSVPEFPILHTLVQNSGLSYYWAGWQTPHWSESLKPKSIYYCLLSHSTPSTPSTSDLQGLLFTSPHGAACLQDPFFWAQQAVESCKLHWQQAQRTSPHCSDTRSCQSEDLRNTKQVSTELLSLQRKGATSFLLCRLSSNLAQQEQLCSTLEPQLSPATTSTFSSKTGNVELGLDSKP